jgi:hypothetical protein
VHGEVLNAEAFVEVGDGLGDGVDDVRDLIADDELDVLGGSRGTFAASWSPMNSPSFILIGPSRNYTVV